MLKNFAPYRLVQFTEQNHNHLHIPISSKCFPSCTVLPNLFTGVKMKSGFPMGGTSSIWLCKELLPVGEDTPPVLLDDDAPPSEALLTSCGDCFSTEPLPLMLLSGDWTSALSTFKECL